LLVGGRLPRDSADSQSRAHWSDPFASRRKHRRQAGRGEKSGDGVTIYLPVGPSSRYYDYSYYYSRGYYPTHIGGYVYYNPKTYNPDYEAAGYEEGAPYSAAERCDRRFRSFEWDTGLYTTYGGNKKLCPYLR
jgi:hypothetical protein